MEKIKKARNIWIALLIAAIAAGGTFVAVNHLMADDPTSVKVTLYQTDLLADASASPQTVFTDAAGEVVDIVGNPGVFGEGTVPQGTYNRMKLTVKNKILYSGLNPCGGLDLTDKDMLIDDTKDPGAQVVLYFATSSDGGGSGWTANGTEASPFLMQNPIEVSANQTTRVELRFNTAGILNCITGSAKLSAPTIDILHYIDEPAQCSIVGEYWLVHYNVGAHIYDDDTGEMLENPAMGVVFERTEVVSGWGTATFDAEGNWSVYPADKYDGTTGYPGMAEHRHNLVSYNPPPAGDDGYHDPSDPAGISGTVMGGQYVTAGSNIIMYFPDGGFIEGGLSSDCNTFVGTNLSTGETDLIYAVRKTTEHAATLPSDRKYVLGQPQFEIHYDGFNKTDKLCLNAEFSVVDTTAGKIFGWLPITQFTPTYDDVSGLLLNWTSKGFAERAQLNDLPAITIRDDGLMTGGPDGFLGLGAGGSGVYAGQNAEDTGGDHRVSAGFILDADTSPSLADLAGTWVLCKIDGEAEYGAGGWDSGDEQSWFGISFGKLTVESSGNVTGEFVFKNAFTGEIEANPVTATISGPVDECYAVGGDITDTSCGGITLPVFIVTSTEGGTEVTVAKIALDRTKNVISIWNPIDTDGIVYDAPVPCTQGVDCGDANPKFQFGLGVKVE